MTYATAITDICATCCNLSTATDHYDTCNDLCSTIMDILETCNNLSTVTDLLSTASNAEDKIFNTHDNLSSTNEHPLRPHCNPWDCNIACRNIHQSSLRLIPSLADPILTFGRLSQSHFRPCNNLGSAITNPMIVLLTLRQLNISGNL